MANSTDIHTGATQESRPPRFKISLELEGFPVEIEAEGRADSLKALIDRLKAIGAIPPTAKPNAPAAAKTAPRCPVHNKAMKASKKPGSWFCPGRNEDGSYCDQNA